MPELERNSSATPEVAARKLDDVPKENLPVGDDPKTPVRPLALQRLRGQAERESPFHLRTPDTPYGISENPSPGERKRLKEWVESIPDYPQSPAYPNRRLSTVSTDTMLYYQS